MTDSDPGSTETHLRKSSWAGFVKGAMLVAGWGMLAVLTFLVFFWPFVLLGVVVVMFGGDCRDVVEILFGW